MPVLALSSPRQGRGSTQTPAGPHPGASPFPRQVTRGSQAPIPSATLSLAPNTFCRWEALSPPQRLYPALWYRRLNRLIYETHSNGTRTRLPSRRSWSKVLLAGWPRSRRQESRCAGAAGLTQEGCRRARAHGWLFLWPPQPGTPPGAAPGPGELLQGGGLSRAGSLAPRLPAFLRDNFFPIK